MPKFLCLQRAMPGADGGEKPSPAQMQAMYAKFNEWRRRLLRRCESCCCGVFARNA